MMMRKLLKNSTFIAILTLTVATVQAQDPSAFLEVRFENNLNATTTDPDGVTFAVSDPDNEGYTISYSDYIKIEGNYAMDFTSILASDNTSIIDNSTSVQIQSTASLAIEGNAARTFAAWIRILSPSGGAGHCMLNMGDPTSASGGRVSWLIDTSKNRIQIAIGGGNTNSNYDTTSTDLNLEDGTWHHVAFTYPAGGVLDDIKFYINGVLTSNDGGTNSSTKSFATVSDKLTVASNGKGKNSQKWTEGGSIDDLRVYDSVLTVDQISDIYDAATLSVGDVAFGEDELIAYPNPVEDFLYLKTTDNSTLDISVLDITGKAIIRTSGDSVDMSELTSGLYIVKVRENNKVTKLKILKK
ncbi:LamG-like jellyroll fold domain-containing protein [Polaribacter sp. Asnod1-A03]|uniref:LamG-like jellyroll fold domain-containing protein n=1 Tax=Polaribacter sp. Asnod1-A03 TaxID=3160581 RepID=UPI00386BAC60